MIEKASKNLKIYLKHNKIYRVILSISGGIDSIVLLDILLEIKKTYKSLNISLYHINYNMHLNSNKSYELCKYLSAKHKLNFFNDNENISGNNFESKARTIRYDNLKKIMLQYELQLILTAHHYDDQLETLIMKHEDNADWVSFLGIRRNYNSIYRPLLDVPKNHIFKYAKKNNLEWVDDPTNNLTIYRRNKIRSLINKNTYSKPFISLLLKKHISAKKSISDFNKLYDKNISHLIAQKCNNALKIKLTSLKTFNVIEFKLFINKILSTYFNIETISCSKHHWKNLYNFLLESMQGKKYIISDNITALNDRGVFILFIDELIDSNCFEKIKFKKVNWYGGTFISSNKILVKDSNTCISVPKNDYKKGLFITHWKHGDKIELSNNSKKISDLFINNKISNYDKKYYPIIRNSKNQIVWVPNLFNKYNKKYKDSIYISWKL